MRAADSKHDELADENGSLQNIHEWFKLAAGSEICANARVALAAVPRRITIARPVLKRIAQKPATSNGVCERGGASFSD